MIVGGMIFITAGDCVESRVWNVAYITITTASALLTMVSYSSFALNLVRSDRGLKTQHISVLAISYAVFFFLLIVSIITMTQCTRAVQMVQKIPELLAVLFYFFVGEQRYKRKNCSYMHTQIELSPMCAPIREKHENQLWCDAHRITLISNLIC
uniref:Uncharacterized protein n=1 Tax=Anopheles culicifacies TaxID=139723 RepID=A0A182MFA3_9DIPT